ncbi:Met-10+ like-protein-domain-containing protein [Vararia minispora EC-137]|uniref:Met-10+ like-protein-domain-containing protein n=1 Tax=Vararia minispora EC-137 TaxID=1314806 RepID=A0ACB8QQV7_9AGAM|nr:Met-10+ like-protein-domain-containing protein [Vararia minispora EC-137]
MSEYNGIDASPPMARWMKDTLDRSFFHRLIPVLAARVSPEKTAEILRAQPLRKTVLDLPKIKSIVPDPGNPNGDKLLLLRVQHEADLTPEARGYLRAHGTTFTIYTLKLNYDYWTADDILHAILPEELLDGAPSGFAAVGHLAHLNLNDEYLPYKHVIGQVIMDKNKSIRTVVNKLNSIDTKFRFFKMELIAGEPNYVVQHSELDCRFIFDFTQVYWNSRLSAEHERLVSLFRPTEVVADVFAGVGPFALPAAKKGCGVLANDLNPSSYKYLQANIQDNKVTDLVRPSCEDGRDFIRNVVWEVLDSPLAPYTPRLSRSEERARKKAKLANTPYPEEEADTSSRSVPRNRIAHFVMNLPDSAITFLDAFRGILKHPRGCDSVAAAAAVAYAEMPMVHCHCFTREMVQESAERDIRQRVGEQLGRALGADDEVSLHLVRSVAPNKDMYCISFRLPRDVAFDLVTSE